MVGNRVFAHTLILGIASALVFTPWGTVRVDPSRGSSPLAGVRLPLEPIWIETTDAQPKPPRQDARRQESPSRDIEQAQLAQEELVFGWQGAIALGRVRIAYWAICGCLMLGAFASSLNFLGWTRLPSLLVFAAFGFTAASALVAAIQHAFVGSVGTGSVLAIVCALLGLLLSPSDEVKEVAGRLEAVEPPRQLRAAA